MHIAHPDSTQEQVQQPRIEIMAYTAQQVCEAIQIDTVTLWRLEKRGLIRRVPGIRHRRYAVAEVKRFVAAAA